MLRLKLGELLLFKSKTGVDWSRARRQMAPEICQKHRLAIGACADCGSMTGLCQAHNAEFVQCDACVMPPIPTEFLAALGWIVRRRTTPDITWEEYLETADEDEALAEINAGNA